MDLSLDTFRLYLQKVLGISPKIIPWRRLGKLPLFLMHSYAFYEMTLLERPCILMIVKESAEITPATIRKHWEQVQKRSSDLCIYVHPVISSHNRRRLIDYRVPFVVPNNQMYLPDLGIDLREHFRRLHSTQALESLSPATQIVVIHALVCWLKDKKFTPITSSRLAKVLGYTVMTMTRAVNELEAAGLGTVSPRGRARWFQFSGTGRQLWEQAKTLMESPEKKRIWLAQTTPMQQEGVIAGLSALAGFSILSPPILPVYAIGTESWRLLTQSEAEELPSPEGAALELQIWHYNPHLFAQGGIVDPFALYLSLRSEQDERIESALQKMMEQLQW